MDASIIAQVLLQAGIAPKVEALQVTPLIRTPGRNDQSERARYRVSVNERPFCHLTVGADLSDLWHRTQGFATACPDISCRPLFFHRTEGQDYLGIEFFDGVDLETLATQGRLSSTEAIACGEILVAALSRTALPSTPPAAAAEMESVIAWVADSPLFGLLDRILLRELVFPFLRAGALAGPHQTRWTNRDLIPRNVLRNRLGELRLIDYEFAQRTHFFAEDWWRWNTHTALPSEARDLPSLRRLLVRGPWLETFFILRQMVLTYETGGAEQGLVDSHLVIDRLTALIATAHSDAGPNVFFKPYASQQGLELIDLRRAFVALSREHEQALQALARAESRTIDVPGQTNPRP